LALRLPEEGASNTLDANTEPHSHFLGMQSTNIEPVGIFISPHDPILTIYTSIKMKVRFVGEEQVLQPTRISCQTTQLALSKSNTSGIIGIL
jgi:hypothetical protein